MVTASGEILANVVSSQGVHDRFGGVVPELASRHHLELVNAVVDDALARAGTGLDELDAVAVTQGPGLVGALLVGVATAKGLAAARRLPLIPVDHLQGHVAANFLAPEPMEPPFVCLIASGGHTLLTRVHDHRGYEVAGRHAGRRRRRGVRQGRPVARASGSPAVRRSHGWRRRRPARVRLPDRREGRRARLLVRRPEDRAALQGPRPRGGGGREARAPTSRRATSTPSSRR